MPTYYHVSSEHFSQLAPTYNDRFGRRGIFVAPNQKAIMNSWATYVAGKRSKKKMEQKLKRFNKKQVKAGEELLAGDEAIFWRGSSREENYQTLYLYTVEIPHEVVREAQELYEKARKLDEEQNPDRVGAAWGWDQELFIPESLLSEIAIEKCQRYPAKELIKKWDTHKIFPEGAYNQQALPSEAYQEMFSRDNALKKANRRPDMEGPRMTERAFRQKIADSHTAADEQTSSSNDELRKKLR